MSDANPAPSAPEVRQKRKRLRELKGRIKGLRNELSTLKAERIQLRSEIPKRISQEDSANP